MHLFPKHWDFWSGSSGLRRTARLGWGRPQINWCDGRSGGVVNLRHYHQNNDANSFLEGAERKLGRQQAIRA